MTKKQIPPESLDSFVLTKEEQAAFDEFFSTPHDDSKELPQICQDAVKRGQAFQERQEAAKKAAEGL